MRLLKKNSEKEKEPNRNLLSLKDHRQKTKAVKTKRVLKVKNKKMQRMMIWKRKMMKVALR